MNLYGQIQLIAKKGNNILNLIYIFCSFNFLRSILVCKKMYEKEKI